MPPNDPNLRTSATLLQHLRDLNNNDAWELFVARYGPLILRWCRRQGLDETDAADASQEVLSKLIQAMRDFRYDVSKGSFRGWLKTVTNNAARDLLRSRNAAGSVQGSGDTRLQMQLQQIQDPDALAELTAAIEAEGERELLQEAELRVRIRVQPKTWQAYQATAVHARKARDVAAELGISVSDVYVAKSRVLKMLREEVERLDASPLDAAQPRRD